MNREAGAEEDVKWRRVWWRQWDGTMVKAIAGPRSKTGRTVRVRHYVQGQGQIERYINPKNVSPR